jgi:hypothetical protein
VDPLGYAEHILGTTDINGSQESFAMIQQDFIYWEYVCRAAIRIINSIYIYIYIYNVHVKMWRLSVTSVVTSDVTP